MDATSVLHKIVDLVIPPSHRAELHEEIEPGYIPPDPSLIPAPTEEPAAGAVASAPAAIDYDQLAAAMARRDAAEQSEQAKLPEDATAGAS